MIPKCFHTRPEMIPEELSEWNEMTFIISGRVWKNVGIIWGRGSFRVVFRSILWIIWSRRSFRVAYISILKQSINKVVILNHRKQHLLLSQVYHSPFPEFYITNTDPQYVHTYPGYQRVYGSFEKQVQKCYCKYIGWPETIYYLCDYEIFFLPSGISSTRKRRFRTS